MLTNFDGQDGLIWWIGIVEDRHDPLYLGRCKVRILAHHTKDKDEMPTEELPWAMPILQGDNGRSVVGYREGDWVIGFFLDSHVKQEPMMFGKVQGYPEREADSKMGFYDPREASGYCLIDNKVPRDPEDWPLQFDDGSGNEFKNRECIHPYPDKRYFYEADTHRLERVEKIAETIVEKKKGDVNIGQKDVLVAYHPDSGVGTDEQSLTHPWTERETPYDAEYPYNHVYAAESGHIFEVDDTPESERLAWYHRVGTFEEIHEEGSRVTKIVESDWNITLAKRYDHIEHSHYETVDKEYRLFVNKDEEDWDCSITVGKGGNINITTDRGDFNLFNQDGNWNVSINGDINLYVKGDVNSQIDGNVNSLVKGDTNITTNGNVNHRIDGNYDLSVGGNFHMDVFGNHTKKIGDDTHEYYMKNWYRIIEEDMENHVKQNSYEYVIGDYRTDIEGKWTSIVGNSTTHYNKGTLNLQTDSSLNCDSVSFTNNVTTNFELNAGNVSIKSVTEALINSGLVTVNSVAPFDIQSTGMIAQVPFITGPVPSGSPGIGGDPVVPVIADSSISNDSTIKYTEQVTETNTLIQTLQAIVFSTMNIFSGFSADGSGFPAYLRNDTSVSNEPSDGILGKITNFVIDIASSSMSSAGISGSPGDSAPGTSSNSGGTGGGAPKDSEPLPEMPEGFLYKPISHSDGNLIMLLPSGKGGFANVITPDGTKYEGRYTVTAHGDREHYRFDQPGESFPNGSTIETSAGSFTIEDSSQRYEGVDE